MESIKVYSTKWCPDCRRVKQLLERHNISFEWIDIEENAAAMEYVQQVNGGYRSIPTIVFPDGSVLVEPSTAELEAKLAELK